VKSKGRATRSNEGLSLNTVHGPPGVHCPLLDHLHGRHVMGAYPMLEDESCWFLAADFDECS
jgi:hypothetical protein